MYIHANTQEYAGKVGMAVDEELGDSAVSVVQVIY